jgi:FKBP-type peptidyl-prolyl cis-trans isomerase
MVVKDHSLGIGPRAQLRDELVVEYHSVDENGKVLYSSWDNVPPPLLYVTLGSDEYFPGFEKGMEGMKLGGRREMLFPAKLTEGQGPLIYVIDLLEINRDGRCWTVQSLRRAGPRRRAEIRKLCDSRVRLP